MHADLKSRADARLEEALERAPSLRDPRPFYRPVLKYLRERAPDSFAAALGHYDEVLVPAVAGGADPLACWLEYGRLLGRAMGPGQLVAVDGTGRAREVEDVAATEGLVLYLPDAGDAPALVMRCPRSGTPHQEAAFELLAEGRVIASAYEGEAGGA
jgi:hypothetical protein